MVTREYLLSLWVAVVSFWLYLGVARVGDCGLTATPLLEI
jgi:hypothetical protein